MKGNIYQRRAPITRVNFHAVGCARSTEFIHSIPVVTFLTLVIFGPFT